MLAGSLLYILFTAAFGPLKEIFVRMKIEDCLVIFKTFSRVLIDIMKFQGDSKPLKRFIKFQGVLRVQGLHGNPV